MNHCDVCILDNLREYTNSGVIDVKRFLKTRTNHSPHYILFNNKPVWGNNNCNPHIPRVGCRKTCDAISMNTLT